MFKYQLSAFADEASKQLDLQLEALRRNGINRIELRGVDGKNVADLTNDEAAAVRKKLDAAGVELSSMGSPFGKYPIEAEFDKHLTAFKRGLEICDILGTKRIRMFSFHIPAGDAAASWRGKVIDQLGVMLEEAEKAGIFLAHENEKGIYGDTAERCLDLAETFAGKMGCSFDPANFIQCGVKPIEAYPMLEKWITYMHIKDAMMADGAVVPAGCGDGSVGEILKKLGAKADAMTLTLEPHLAGFVGLGALQTEEVKHKYSYATNDEAFDAAVTALKGLLTGNGYAEKETGIWAL